MVKECQSTPLHPAVYQCLVLDRRRPLIGDGVDGDILLGSNWVGQYHDVAFVRGNSVRLQLGDQGGVLGVFKEPPHFPILFVAQENIVLFLTTLAVTTYFSIILNK